MASTNKTTNYELSQFQGSDIPAWLTDYNGDMQKIDAGIHAAKTQAAGAASGVSALQTAVSGKQDRLTFDSTPISGSSNPVTSGGVYDALQNVSVQTDAVPTEGSTKPVQSGGVYDAIHSYIGGEVSVVQPSASYGRTYDARAFYIAGMLVFARITGSRDTITKNSLTQIESSTSYAYTDTDYAISGNPLGLTTYAENTLAWRNQSQRQSFNALLYNTDNTIAGTVNVSLRYDGVNTRIVYVVLLDTYNNISGINAMTGCAPFYAFIKRENS